MIKKFIKVLKNIVLIPFKRSIRTILEKLKILPKDSIKITQTDIGGHGNHWHLLFGDIDTSLVEKKFDDAVEAAEQTKFGNNITFFNNGLIRAIAYKNEIFTGFPYLKGSKYENFQVDAIEEWSQVNNLEAIVFVGHDIGFGLAFFATDYAINKEIYKTQKNLKIKISGFIYSITSFDIEQKGKEQQIEFSEDFCCFFPRKEEDGVIYFIGKIKDIREHSANQIDGVIIKLDLVPEFEVELFVAKNNIKTDIKIGQHIEGNAWIQGTMEV